MTDMKERKELSRRLHQRMELVKELNRVWSDFKLDPPMSLPDKGRAAITFAAIICQTIYCTAQMDMGHIMTKQELTLAVSSFRDDLRTCRDMIREHGLIEKMH